MLAPGAPGLPDGVLGAAVAEWVPGLSLAEAVADGMLKPLAAARALQPLAAAAEAAHRHGHVLGCDHPQRIRLNHDGRLQLGFALPRPELTPADDVRGLGAALYTLLTARLAALPVGRRPGGAPACRARSRRDAAGAVRGPSRRARRAGDAGRRHPRHRIRAPGGCAPPPRCATSSTRSWPRRTASSLFPPEHDGVPPEPGDVWQPRGALPKQADPRRRRKLAVGLAGLGLCVLAVAGYMSVQLGELFGDPTPRIVVGSSAGGPSGGRCGGPQQADGAGGAPVGDAAVKAVGADVYDDAGDRDNAGKVSRVIDGNPDTGWKTFSYRQQFPALKPGVGIMTSFASPVQLSSLIIESPSPGTEIEIRSAPSSDATLADTVLLTRATLDDGDTTVPLTNSQPVQYVLLWITHLGGGGSDNSTEIREVSFRRVAD